ncbi:MAG: hypothetical protein K2G51_02325 [Lachnospiraceae bacterium]|nr:hypothetical protein [Lachnospiraceae bacterium]
MVSAGACGATFWSVVVCVGMFSAAEVLLSDGTVAGCDSCGTGVSAGVPAFWVVFSAAYTDIAGAVTKSIAAEVHTSILLIRLLL